MSDDRFKQARRSLINKHNQRHNQGPESGYDDFEDDKTQMVEIDRGRRPGPPPASNFDHASMDSAHEGATQLFERPPDVGATPARRRHGHSAPPIKGRFGNSPPPLPSYPPSKPAPVHSPSNQVFIPSDDDGGLEGHTQFVNVNEFASNGQHFTPEQQAAGYAGNTQFVDVNALMVGTAAAHQGSNIENDSLLRQSYAFGPESIQRTEDIVLIFAQNALGKQVILKRVWEGNPDQMSTPLRQRVAQLFDLKHPNLIPMNGMFVTHSGLWVELERPNGVRLTQVLQQYGPQEPDAVMGWIATTAEILERVHAQQLAYANLTTDALWIQNDGSVLVEPFDMLRFEDRGNLGNFGPREMHRPLEQRQLHPTTDVYCLGAVTLASLTGLPLDLNRIAELDKKTASALQKAFAPNPAERPQSATALVQSLSVGKRSGGSTGLQGTLAKLDVKIVAAIAVLGLMGLVGYLHIAQENAAAEVAQRAAAKQDAERERRQQADAVPAPAAIQDGTAPSADLRPANVVNDTRLSIRTSYSLNPPRSTARKATPEQITQWRAQAIKAKNDADRLGGNDAWEKYQESLRALTNVIRNSEVPTEEDQKLLIAIYAQPIVKTELDAMRKRIETLVKEGSMANARRFYQRLSEIDPSANALEFFVNTTSATIRKVPRSAN